MLAVTLTFLLAAFFLGPDLLSRLVLSFVVPRRSVTQNRGEEVTRAILRVAGPLLIVAVWVKTNHVLRLWGHWSDLQVVASGLYSSSFFDAHRQEFFGSLGKVFGMAWSLLWRLYLLVLVMALIVNTAILRYRWLRGSIRGRWAKSLLASMLLPRVSEWHVLLSDMLLPADDVSLAVDVLTRNGTLYQGGVQDRMLAADGSLQTLTLTDPRRFLRDDFRKAREVNEHTQAEDYWRPIPGKLFVMMAADIASVNVRYLPKKPTSQALTGSGLSEPEVNALRELLSKLAETRPKNPD